MSIKLNYIKTDWVKLLLQDEQTSVDHRSPSEPYGVDGQCSEKTGKSFGQNLWQMQLLWDRPRMQWLRKVQWVYLKNTGGINIKT